MRAAATRSRAPRRRVTAWSHTPFPENDALGRSRGRPLGRPHAIWHMGSSTRVKWGLDPIAERALESHPRPAKRVLIHVLEEGSCDFACLSSPVRSAFAWR